MIEINKIEFEDKVYALYFDVKNTPKGLSFISDDKDFIQVGMWNYDAKKFCQLIIIANLQENQQELVNQFM